MEEDTTNEEPFQTFTKTLSELQDATGQQTSFADKFPRFTVHGNQGVGKSSVLEQIVGKPFLPRGGNIVTRFVQDITTQHTVRRACAAAGDSFTLSTFANFGQREHWKFKQSNVKE